MRRWSCKDIGVLICFSFCLKRKSYLAVLGHGIYGLPNVVFTITPTSLSRPSQWWQTVGDEVQQCFEAHPFPDIPLSGRPMWEDEVETYPLVTQEYKVKLLPSQFSQWKEQQWGWLHVFDWIIQLDFRLIYELCAHPLHRNFPLLPSWCSD